MLSENQWWAYLDNSKPKDLRQLLKNYALTSAFDSLLDMSGLWAKFQLGALHRLLALKCDEVRLYPLCPLYSQFLTRILGNDSLLGSRQENMGFYTKVWTNHLTVLSRRFRHCRKTGDPLPKIFRF